MLSWLQRLATALVTVLPSPAQTPPPSSARADGVSERYAYDPPTKPSAKSAEGFRGVVFLLLGSIGIVVS